MFFICRYIRNLAKEGAVINRHIVKSTAYGIVKYHKPSQHSSIEFTDAWARSLMERMNLVKRKGMYFYNAIIYSLKFLVKVCELRGRIRSL
jgi:hypothetical protein